MSRTWVAAFLIIGALAGCSLAPLAQRGHLGYSEGRRVAIVGENVEADIAMFYQRTYDGMVWFTPSEGKFSDSANRVLEGLGPSKGMRMLIAELESINHTVGRWEIIIPGIAEKYFLATLKHMGAGALAKARGMIILIDSSGSPQVEAQVKRVTEDSFFVTYEFQRGLPK